VRLVLDTEASFGPFEVQVVDGKFKVE